MLFSWHYVADSLNSNRIERSVVGPSDHHLVKFDIFRPLLASDVLLWSRLTRKRARVVHKQRSKNLAGIYQNTRDFPFVQNGFLSGECRRHQSVLE